MAQASESRIEAHIHGDVSGQVAVGENILQIGPVSGGVVTVLAPGERPETRPRPAPVLLLPRPIPGLLDCHLETADIDAAVGAGQVVEVSARPGLGKTALLRHVAHRHGSDEFPAGIVYLSARHRPLEDVYQALFDAFNESTGLPYRASEAEVRHALAGQRALVLLDDVDLEREAVQALCDGLPGLTMVLAAREQHLWGEARALALGGLPADDARALLAQSLGRAIGPDEAAAGDTVVSALEGNPLALIQAAARARDEALDLATLAASFAGAEPGHSLVRDRAANRPEPQRRILALLAAVAGCALPARAVASLADVAGADSALSELAGLSLLESADGGYWLADGLTTAVADGVDVDGAVARAIAHVTAAGEPPPVDAALDLLGHAERLGRWHDVIALARAVEASLVLELRWGGWRIVLEAALRASRTIADRAAEAWALHQLGTRAMSLGDMIGGEALLHEASGIRESLGDAAGASASRGNLAPDAAPGRAPRRGWLGWVGGALVSVGVLVGGAYAARDTLNEWLVDWIRRGLAPTPAQVVEVSPRFVDFGTADPGAMPVPRALVLRNTTGAPVALAPPTLEGDGAFRVSGDACGGRELPAGGKCRVELLFEPTGPGAFSALVRFAAIPDPGTPVAAELVGRAAAGELAASPAPLEFEPVAAGSQPVRELSLGNAGTGTATLGDLAIEGGDTYAVVGGSCSAGLSLDPGDACTVAIRFSPAGDGPAVGTLTVSGRFDGSPLRVALHGSTIALQRAALEVEPAALDFGVRAPATASEARRVAVRNGGDAAAVLSVVLEGPGREAFAVHDECTAQPLAPGQACALEIRFEPPGAGLARASVRIGAADVPARTVTLAGRGEAPAGGLVVTPGRVDFGTVEVGRSSRAVAVIVRNDGARAQGVRRITVPGGDAAGFRVVANGCSRRSVPAGGRCEVKIVFEPAAAGVREAALHVEADDGARPRVAALLGTGTRTREAPVAALRAAPDPLRLGTAALGARTAATLALRNAGNVALAIEGTAIEGAARRDFRVGKDGCAGAPLAPGAVCRMEVVFAPTLLGTRAAEVVVRSDAAREQRVVVSGRGTTPIRALPELPAGRPAVTVPLPPLPEPPRAEAPAARPVPQEPTPPARPTEPQATPTPTRPAATAAPDLVVDSVGAGKATAGADGSFRVPIAVRIGNRGAKAGRFAVALLRDGGTLVPFNVAGESDQWRPEVAGLGAGASVTLHGTTTLPGELAGRSVRLSAEVDSCKGVEFAAAHCRVKESNERNNVGRSRTPVEVPALRIMEPKFEAITPKAATGIIQRMPTIK